jgi:hypothetical protein
VLPPYLFRDFNFVGLLLNVLICLKWNLLGVVHIC